MKSLPARLFICPGCGYSNPYRWVLAQHLERVHGVRKRAAREIAAANEYLANPVTYRRVDEDEFAEDDDEQ